jgi:hypothetical protein
MTYEDQINTEQSIISSLRNQLKNIRLPSRTITWQHQNISSGVGTIQDRLNVRRQKLQINNKIISSQNKICSLKSALFGDALK